MPDLEIGERPSAMAGVGRGRARRRALPLLFAALALLGAGGGADLARADSAEPAIGHRDRALMALASRDPTAAAAALELAIAEEPPEAQPALLLLMASARAQAGTPERALAVVARLLAAHPDAPERAKARFLAAEVHAARRAFAEAERILADELARLLDDARRGDIARTYLELGREIARPRGPGEAQGARNLHGARQLFARALEIGGLTEDDEIALRLEDLAAAEELRVGANIRLAAAEALLAAFPNGPRRDEALLAHGKALGDSGRIIEARRAWGRVASEHATSTRAAEALLLSARIELGADGGAWGERADAIFTDALGRALAIADELVKRYPDTPEAPEAALFAALALSRHSGMRAEARARLEAFAERFPTHERAIDARIRVAELHAADGAFDAATAAYEQALRAHAESPRWSDVQTRIARTRRQIVLLAMARKDHEATLDAARRFLERHPDDGSAAEVARIAGEALLALDRVPEAVESWRRAAARYPRAQEAGRMRLLVAKALAERLEELDAAFEELAQVTGSSVGEARAYAATLRAPALSVRAGALGRGESPPAVELTTRNVERVRFRAWAVDVGDIFDKNGATSALAGLDLAVIAPDVTWEVEVERYRAFVERKQRVAVPEAAPGVYVVLADAGELESTTVLPVTSLDLLARIGAAGGVAAVLGRPGAAEGTLRIARDGKEGAPVALGARVTLLRALIDPAPADAEGPSLVGLLARRGGHVAFADAPLGSVEAGLSEVAVGLSPGPVAREGEPVPFVAVVRVPDASGRALVAPPAGRKYRLRAAHTRSGVAFFERDVEADAFGVVAVDVLAPPGMDAVSFRLESLAGPTPKPLWTTACQLVPRVGPVRPGSLEGLGLPERVHDRGPLAVSLILRDGWGRALADHRVDIPLTPHSAPVAHRTDAHGVVRVTYEDVALWGDAIRVEAVAAIGPTIIHHVPVVRAGYALSFDDSLAGRSDALVPGAAARFAVRARRFDDAPEVGLAVVLQLREAAGALVATGEGVTDADGVAWVELAMPERGGRYLIRASASRADGLRVAEQHFVDVLSLDDGPELLVLGDAPMVEVGSDLGVTIWSRVEGKALVTLESDRVERAEVVALRRGATRVALGAAPGRTSRLRAAVELARPEGPIGAERVLGARAPTLVVEPAKIDARPGETAAVTVRARPGQHVWLAVGEVAARFPPADFLVPSASAELASARLPEGLLDARNARVDAQTLNALSQIANVPGRPVQFSRELRAEPSPQQQLQGFAEAAGEGQAARRLGRGGPPAAPPPIAWLRAEADANGEARFRVDVPAGAGSATYQVRAIAVGEGAWLRQGEAELRAHAPVTAALRAPEVARPGEATFLAVMLTNHTDESHTVAVAIDGAPQAETVPARSAREVLLPWRAAAEAVVTVDGIVHRADVPQLDAAAELSAGAADPVAAGGIVRAPARLWPGPEVEGTRRALVATGVDALLEALADGGRFSSARSSFTPASDAAAGLLAELALHRRAARADTHDYVRTFEALRAAGVVDHPSDDVASAILAHLALAEAKAAGFDVQVTADAARARFSAMPDDDGKALLLFALARSGHAEYGYVHRLVRGADKLSPRALAAVALALWHLDKPDEARAVLARLVGQLDGAALLRVSLPSTPDASATPLAATALAALALARIDPASPARAALYDGLLARPARTAAERAFVALALESAAIGPAAAAVIVDGQRIERYAEVTLRAGEVTLEARPGEEPAAIAIAWLSVAAPVGEADLSAEVKVDSMKVSWPALRLDGVGVAPAIAAQREPVTNPAPEVVRVGDSLWVDLVVRVSGPSTQVRDVALGLPPGFIWDPSQGGAQASARTRSEPGRVVVRVPPFVESARRVGVRLPLYAAFPTAAPDRGYPRIVVAAESPREGYLLTHGERLAIGRLHMTAERWAEAVTALLPLFEEGELTASATVEGARLLAQAAIALERHDLVVRFFEVMKERAPGEVFSFEHIRAVATAYRALGEHERAMQVHEGTFDAYFLQEVYLVGVLEARGRFAASAERMESLLYAYPDSPLVRQTAQALAQRLYQRGRERLAAAMRGEVGPGAGGGGSSGAGGADEPAPEALWLRAAAIAAGLFARFPQDDAAADVALTLASVELEAARFQRAERWGKIGAERFPSHALTQSFDYARAVALFAQRRFEDALALCQRIEGFGYDGRSDGAMRDRATLMRAHIHHAKGEVEPAIAAYRQVAARLADARRAIAFLEDDAVTLPPVTVAPLARPAALELGHASGGEAHVRVYKVDLVALALRRGDIADASSVEVAGIRPAFDGRFALTASGSRRRVTERLELTLPDPGAYLVSVKCGSFVVHGLLLRSDLAVRVQEDAGEGLARVNVHDVAKGGPVEGVKVCVLGTEERRIAMGSTDLRGVWESAGVTGFAVVVCEKDGHVAVHRGETRLGATRSANQRAPSPSSSRADEVDLLEKQLELRNRMGQDAYEGNFQRLQQGVEVERTKR